MSVSVDKPNDPVIGQFGIPEIPPYGVEGVPVRSSASDLSARSTAMIPQTGGGVVSTPGLGRTTARPVTIPASYQAPATPFTYSFVDFAQVPPGKIWMVLRIGISSSDPFTVLAGATALAYRSSFIPQDSNAEPPTFGDLIAVMGQIPNTSFPAWKSVFARSNERIVIAVKGLSVANQQLQASLDVIEYDLYTFLTSLYGG